jgi:predicted 3-demethylubiquinone-9 3-methyltransferase (glyoxalase superfamily)
MSEFITFLWFDANAEEAARFYTGVFKNSKLGDPQSGPEGKPMLVEFELNGQRFTAFNGGPGHDFNDAVSLVVPCADQAEVDYYWDALLAGGGQALGPGWVRDRYGLCWQVVPTVFFDMLRNPARAAAVMQAMMTMTKFDIAGLEQAYAGS